MGPILDNSTTWCVKLRPLWYTKSSCWNLLTDLLWLIRSFMSHNIVNNSLLLLKSVHFKNTVTRSSFHSKLWPFSIIHQLTWHQNKVSWCIIENGHSFEWNEDHVTLFLKWKDFSMCEKNWHQKKKGLHK